MSRRSGRLRGLPGVQLDVLAEITGDPPISESEVRTTAELRLRRVGIRLLSDEERLSVPGSPRMLVHLICIRVSMEDSGRGVGYACSLNLKFAQRTTLVRNGALADGITYHVVDIFVDAESRIASFIRERLEARLDMFANDFLEANPPGGD